MKMLARSSGLIVSALLATLMLANCGGGPTNAATTSTSTTTFAYLQNSAGGYKSNAFAAAAVRFASARKTTSRKSLKTRFHMAHARVSASVNLATGPVHAYLLNAATGVTTKLSSSGAMYNGIQLSPDGSKVVFTAFDGGGASQIFIASIANFDSPTQLTSSATVDHLCPRFSPDGAMVLSTIMSPDPNSGSLTLAIATVPSAGGTETVISPSDMSALTPVLTPDGQKILFTAAGDGSPLNIQFSGYISIFAMNLDGTGLTLLSGSTGTYVDILPSVSPDGTKIVFTRILPNSTGTGPTYISNIYVMGIEGESLANLATQLTTDGLSWNATFVGNHITFASMRSNPATMTNNLYEMDATGANQTRLTNTSAENAFNLFSLI